MNSNLQDFCQQPDEVLECGHPVITLIHGQKVVAYLLSPDHYHGLIRPANNPNAPLTTAPELAAPPGKFAMYPGWQPDQDFIQLAAIWGTLLTQPPTAPELAAFVSYWQAEGKMFHHIQWMQKLTRSVQVSRGIIASAAKTAGKRDITQISEPDQTVPDGFRG